MTSVTKYPKTSMTLLKNAPTACLQGKQQNMETWQNSNYRSGTVNSKSFVGKVLLQIKWKFELNSTL